MKRTTILTLLILSLLTMFGLSSAHAQIGSATVTAQGNFTLNSGDVLTLKVQIVSCGQGALPLYNGSPISITPNQTAQAPFTANSSQLVQFTVPGNDKILCSSQNYTMYALTWMDNGFPIAPTVTYRFSDSSSYILSNLTPISFVPPVINKGAGSICPSGQQLFGFNSDYTVNCGVLTTTAIVNMFQVSPSVGFSTIQAAVTAAGSTGYVFIAPSYTGSDTWVNANNIRIDDKRPYNPTNANLGPNGPMPQTTIKAADYGTRCDGVHDDAASINEALAAATTLSAGAGGGTRFMGGAVVELPQGSCVISTTLISRDYGSIIGSPNGTWIFPLEPWLGTSGDLIDITTTYFPSTSNGNHQVRSSMTGRSVKNINFEYNFNVTQHTAIKVFDPTGQQATPYPAGAQIANYQIPGVTIEGNFFYTLDTAIDFEDCGECVAFDNQIFFVRFGIVDGGNNYGLVIDDNGIQVGSWNFTAPSFRTGSTIGIEAGLENRWGCSNQVINCTGGTISQGQIITPQGLNVSNNDITGFDTDMFIANMQGLTVSGGGFDFGGSGSAQQANPTGDFPVIFLGPTLDTTRIHDAYIATNQPNGIDIEIGAPTTPGAGSGETYNDMDIHDNYIYSYQTSQGLGILMDSGSFAANGRIITGNTFGNLGYAIEINHPLQYSSIRDNYGFALSGSGALINLNAAGSTSFLNTTIEGNKTNSNVLAIFDQAGSGYWLGRNFSPVQFTGTQTVQGAGCSFSAGAIGNHCNATITFTASGGVVMTGSYLAICTLQGTAVSGNATLGAISALTATSLTIAEIALDNATTGGGSINCNLTQK